jgi:serine/threonine protein kinase
MDEKNDKLPFPGEIIKTRRNEYEVFRLLGKGGFGAVYEVKRLHDGEFFAAKCETYDVKKRVTIFFLQCI